MSEQIDLDKMAQVALLAAKKAGGLLKEFYRKSYTISTKGWEHNLVTEADLAAERVIIEAISNAFENHTIFSEEAGLLSKATDAPIWLIDPLDGTFNFVHKLPLFAVSIGAFYKNEAILGVIYAPLLDELFFAKKGHGAYFNDTKIHVSKTNKIESAVLVTGIPYYDHAEPHRGVKTFAKMMALGCPIRDLGSCAIDLSYVAAGRFDGYWMPTVQPWDMAAGKCILEEAGGKLTLYDGAPYQKLEISPLVASNGLIHRQLIDALHE